MDELSWACPTAAQDKMCLSDSGQIVGRLKFIFCVKKQKKKQERNKELLTFSSRFILSS